MDLPEIYIQKETTTDYSSLLQATIADCVRQLEFVTSKAGEIQTQGGLYRFLNKSKNIQELAQFTETIATVQQRTFDLVMLLMGAAGRTKEDYNTVLETIEELCATYEGNNDILEYLVKVKSMVTEVQRQDQRFAQLSLAYENLADRVENMETRRSFLGQKLQGITETIKENNLLIWFLLVAAIFLFLSILVF